MTSPRRSGRLNLVWRPVAEPMPSGEIAIALTPEALQVANDRGEPISVVDDHIDRASLCADADAYFAWQIDWLGRIDSTASLRGAAKTAALHLTWPVDSVVMAARVLRALVRSVAPSLVRYIGPSLDGAADPSPFHDDHLQFWPRLGDAPLASRLLPIICRQEQVDFEVVTTPWPGRAQVDPAPRWRPPVALRRGLASLRNAWRLRPPGRDQPASVFLWRSGYGIRALVAETSARRVLLLKRGGPSTRLSLAGPWGLLPATRPVPISPVPGNQVSEGLARLLAEVDRWAWLPGAAEVLASRFELFTTAICPVVADAADQLARDFRRLRVGSMSATNPSSLEEFAALLGAAQCPTIRRTLFQHGDGMFPYTAWLVTETPGFDTMAVSDVTVPDDLTCDAHRIGTSAPGFVTVSPRVSDLRRRAARCRERVPSARPVVCYVPSFFMGDSDAVHRGYYDDAWYHRWHLRLLDLMKARLDADFIWKGLPSADEALDPMPAKLLRDAVANVRYEARPFRSLLPDVDRVIIDFPSTALYEAVHFGKPVLALTFPPVRVRTSAAKLLSAVYRPVGDVDQAAEVIHSFLNDPPPAWMVARGELFPE